jgi:hypothetical protein
MFRALLSKCFICVIIIIILVNSFCFFSFLIDFVYYSVYYCSHMCQMKKKPMKRSLGLSRLIYYYFFCDEKYVEWKKKN